MRTREPRREVLLKARMRADGNWSDVTIRNMSSRGMMLWSDEPPRPGAYIEICGPATSVVMRTVWADGGYFGVRAQDKLDVESALRGGRWRPADPVANDTGCQHHGVRDVAMGHNVSRFRGARLEFGALLVGALGIAILVGTVLHKLLAAPFTEISAKLGG
jgi:hypothetical protein